MQSLSSKKQTNHYEWDFYSGNTKMVYQLNYRRGSFSLNEIFDNLHLAIVRGQALARQAGVSEISILDSGRAIMREAEILNHPSVRVGHLDSL